MPELLSIYHLFGDPALRIWESGVDGRGATPRALRHGEAREATCRRKWRQSSRKRSSGPSRRTSTPARRARREAVEVSSSSSPRSAKLRWRSRAVLQGEATTGEPPPVFLSSSPSLLTSLLTSSRRGEALALAPPRGPASTSLTALTLWPASGSDQSFPMIPLTQGGAPRAWWRGSGHLVVVLQLRGCEVLRQKPGPGVRPCLCCT